MDAPALLFEAQTLMPPPGDGPSLAWREDDGQIYAFRYDKGRCVPFVLLEQLGVWERLAVN